MVWVIKAAMKMLSSMKVTLKCNVSHQSWYENVASSMKDLNTQTLKDLTLPHQKCLRHKSDQSKYCLLLFLLLHAPYKYACSCHSAGILYQNMHALEMIQSGDMTEH